MDSKTCEKGHNSKRKGIKEAKKNETEENEVLGEREREREEKRGKKRNFIKTEQEIQSTRNGMPTRIMG